MRAALQYVAAKIKGPSDKERKALLTMTMPSGLSFFHGIGINFSLVSRVAAGAGLRGEAARRFFVLDNQNLTSLTDDQQKRLLQVNLPSYEAIVRRGVHAAINSGDKRKAARIIEEQVRSKGKVLRGLVRRRHDEAMLLLEGRY